jgi:(2Fe-2S) ferredoxin
LEGYKLKYLRLRTVDQDFLIKIPKELRGGMVYKLSLGDRIRCLGIQKNLKLKADSIEKVDGVDKSSQLAQVREYVTDKSKVKILICQKSHCLNNGAKEVHAALTEQINIHNLSDRITLQSTGCLKCCKQAPNLIVLPEKSCHSNVKTSQIPVIISKIAAGTTSVGIATPTK